jgi:hypothetical protein
VALARREHERSLIGVFRITIIKSDEAALISTDPLLFGQGVDMA